MCHGKGYGMLINCDDCGETHAKYYGPMLHDNLWSKVSDNFRQLLCSQCVEKRLGRKIEFEDMKLCPLSLDWWREHGTSRNVQKEEKVDPGEG